MKAGTARLGVHLDQSNEKSDSVTWVSLMSKSSNRVGHGRTKHAKSRVPRSECSQDRGRGTCEEAEKRDCATIGVRG